MKNFLAIILTFGVFSLLSGQEDIKTMKDFNSKLGVQAQSMVEPSTIYYKDGRKLEGYMVYESSTLEPNFAYMDMQRFGYNENGKIKTDRMKVSKMDSLVIADRIYRFMDIKVSAGLVSMTKKDAMYRIEHNFKRSAIIVWVPTSNSLVDDGTSSEPVQIVWNKETNKFFQLNVAFAGITKGISKLFADCPSLGANLKDAKDAEPKKSLLQKAMANEDTQKNQDLAYIACQQYDLCDGKK